MSYDVEVRVFSPAPQGMIMIAALWEMIVAIGSVAGAIIVVLAAVPTVWRFFRGSDRPHLSLKVMNWSANVADQYPPVPVGADDLGHFFHLIVRNRRGMSATARNTKVLITRSERQHRDGSVVQTLTYALQPSWSPREEGHDQK